MQLLGAWMINTPLSRQAATVRFMAGATSTTSSSGGLAFTGSDDITLLRLALGLVVAGAIALLVVRLRDSARH